MVWESLVIDASIGEQPSLRKRLLARPRSTVQAEASHPSLRPWRPLREASQHGGRPSSKTHHAKGARKGNFLAGIWWGQACTVLKLRFLIPLCVLGGLRVSPRR